LKTNKTIFHRFFIVGFMVLFMCSCANVQRTKVKLGPVSSFPIAQRYVIAAVPFQYKAEQEQYKSLSNKLVDLTIDELLKTGRFRVLERSRIDAILQEIQLSQMGIIDEAVANQIGKQLGAEMVLVGILTAIKPIKKRDSLGIVWQETSGFEVSLQGRLINIKTGEIVVTAKATGMESQQKKMAFGAKTAVAVAEETLLNRAAETATKILIHNLSSQISPKTNP